MVSNFFKHLVESVIFFIKIVDNFPRGIKMAEKKITIGSQMTEKLFLQRLKDIFSS